jgi:hypothetical protein
MKFPNESDLGYLNRKQVINLLLTSIGFEELALAQMVKSEAELLKMALGKRAVKGKKACAMVNSVDDLLRLNHSVNNTLQTITEKERILLSKLKEVANLPALERKRCPCDCLEPANICECSVNITTNQNTDITITGENIFSPGTLLAFFIDIPCNCDASNSSISALVGYDTIRVGIYGEFVEGTLSTLCDGNIAMIQGSVIFGDVFYNLYIQANQDGTATATFEGESIFTITLSGASVVIGNCNNTFSE